MKDSTFKLQIKRDIRPYSSICSWTVATLFSTYTIFSVEGLITFTFHQARKKNISFILSYKWSHSVKYADFGYSDNIRFLYVHFHLYLNCTYTFLTVPEKATVITLSGFMCERNVCLSLLGNVTTTHYPSPKQAQTLTR